MLPVKDPSLGAPSPTEGQTVILAQALLSGTVQAFAWALFCSRDGHGISVVCFLSGIEEEA